MMKTTLLKPRLPYLWEFIISEPRAVPMREARAFIERQIFSVISPETKVRIYIRIEKDGGKPTTSKQGE